MKNTFLLLWTPELAWIEDKWCVNSRIGRQPADFKDQLFVNRMVILGDPFGDASGSVVVVASASEQAVADLFARDPFVVHGIFALDILKQWQLFWMRTAEYEEHICAERHSQVEALSFSSREEKHDGCITGSVSGRSSRL